MAAVTGAEFPADPGLELAGVAGFVGPEVELAGLSDHDLLVAVAVDQRLVNCLEASRQAKIAEFHGRRVADFLARRAIEPHFTMTPLRETAVEVAPLVGVSEGRVKGDLRTTRMLRDTFPGVWPMVASGQLDLRRAGLLTDAAETHLKDHPEAVAEFAERMTAWFTDHLEQRAGTAPTVAGGAGPVGRGGPLVSKTAKQIGNRISYLVKVLRPKDAQARFNRRFADRTARVESTGDGMGQLVLSHDVASMRAVDYRLTLVAKAMRRDGDKRTLAQLRTDLAVDLLLGRLTIGAETGAFEHPDTSPTGDPLDSVTAWPAQAWARPVVNVTVPIQTLMGVSDHPGVLSGGETIPAGLVRAIAEDPHSTWYRMLTDPARKCLELSVKGYKPTGPIVRQTVADHGTCFGPACVVPSVECELDHRVPYPKGTTSTDNLGPGCKSHHQAKHAPGFGLVREPTGELMFTTAAGLAHRVDKADQPVTDDWGAARIWDGEHTLAEVREALMFLAHERTRVDSNAAWIRELDQAWADYRASYPDASDEEIWGWIHDDDPAAPSAPPVLRRGTTLRDVLAAEQPTPINRTSLDDETRYELDDLTGHGITV